MDPKRKAKIVTATTLLNGILFLMSGSVFLTDNKVLFGSIQVLAGLFNLYSGFRMARAKPMQELYNHGIMVFNIVVAITVSIDYFQAGTDYIQYAWILVAIITFIALLIQIRKSKSSSTSST